MYILHLLLSLASYTLVVQCLTYIVVKYAVCSVGGIDIGILRDKMKIGKRGFRGRFISQDLFSYLSRLFRTVKV